MKSPKILALLVFALPLPALAGGNVLNGPRNCQSLSGDASDDTGKHAGRLDSLCTKLSEGNASESDLRELREGGLEIEDKYGR